jgi:hypothetical protein
VRIPEVVAAAADEAVAVAAAAVVVAVDAPAAPAAAVAPMAPTPHLQILPVPALPETAPYLTQTSDTQHNTAAFRG